MKKNTKESSKNAEEKASSAKTADSAGKIAIKEMTPEEKRTSQIQGIIKTAVAAYLGVVAGAIAYFQLDAATGTQWYALLAIIAILAYYVQRLIFPILKIDPKEFGIKGWLYVEFIVIDFCLVTWTLLLN
ncbi:phage shock protein PspC (stress-responsive transcriptional regulator) [Methanohalophilus levihalophilus]|uniref:EMC6-like membrane protein n=1 Tax=Methanohalophilus levihalophilus TaxID=1431282 RepID=UPI001AE3E72E|nr:hypothetical protein [Methanohalophilus levihalophilus]MBP2030581.1 phage shock protein PspC (stress-responsive transcriptional regulator) [Methanohalophilus levihalophilus]